MKKFITHNPSKKHFLLFLTFIFCTQFAQSQLEPNVLWAKQFGGPEQDYGGDMAMDHLGNIYVTGFFRGTADFGDFSITAPGSSAPFVIKTDPSGNVLWAKQFGGTGLDRGHGITTDTFGNVYTTGIFTGTVSFGSITLSTNTKPTAFVVKQDTDGNVLWAKKFADVNEQEIVYAQAIAIDTQNNVYTSGDFYSTADFDGTILTNENNPENNAFLVKQNDSGDVLWAKKIGEIGSLNIHKISTDSTDNIYVTGNFFGTVSIGGNTSTSYTDGELKGFLLKLDTSGEVVWVKYFGEDQQHISSTGRDIKIDNNGNIYVIGSFKGTFSMDAINVSSSYENEFVLKLNDVGQPLEIKTFENPNQTINRITTNTLGDVYIVGNFTGTVYLGDFSLTSAGGSDCLIIKMDSSGDVKWVGRFGSFQFDGIWGGIEINTNEELYILGYFEQTVDFGGITLSSNNSSRDLFLAKLILEDMYVEQNQISQLKVYPNPVKDFLTINISDKDVNLSAEIVNLLGQKIKIFDNVSKTENLDMSDLASGIYLLNLINQNQEKQTIKIKKI